MALFSPIITPLQYTQMLGDKGLYVLIAINFVNACSCYVCVTTEAEYPPLNANTKDNKIKNAAKTKKGRQNHKLV